MDNMFEEKRIFFMTQALAQAREALKQDEIPIGAVVVDPTGKIVARAHNLVQQQGCQIAHAEMLALQKACAKLGDWRLDGYWIYVTLEPCAMCMNFMKLCRIAGVIYGADSPLFGYHLDKKDGVRVYNNNAVQIFGGVCAEKSASLLKQFFKKKRKKGERVQSICGGA